MTSSKFKNKMDVEDGVKRDEGMEVIPSGITRRRRSRIDVTDTQAYKDLYANNLRLYGFLLQKVSTFSYQPRYFMCVIYHFNYYYFGSKHIFDMISPII